MLLRTLLQALASRRRPPLGIHDVSETRFRVMPTDIDVLNHLNNGMYFSFMDLGRMDLLIRSGVLARVKRLGFYPVVANATLTFRKSLEPWQRFAIQSRIVGYDEKSVFVEQRFVVNGEIYARGFMRGRFLKRTGGTVSLAELTAALNVDTSEVPLPAWLTRWVDDIALPTTKAPAPSDW